MPELVRVNKYLAHTTGLSRREADTAIEQGRVSINGKPARLGNIINPANDRVLLDDTGITKARQRYTYLLLNKPVGYVCSRKQQGESPTIYDLLPRQYHHLKVAGRLDKDSCGLVLLTDDGDMIFKLTHPKFGKQKIYHVALNKPLKSEDKQQAASGVRLEDGLSRLQVTRLRNSDSPPPGSQLRAPNLYMVTMHEGRNRQIRRTFKHLGYTVTHLERIGFGTYSLSQLLGKPYLQI